jgi:hypothetical protein
MRIGFVVIGSTLLWLGTSQISILGLLVMLIGLVAVVAACSMPLPRLRTVLPARTLTQVFWHQRRTT